MPDNSAVAALLVRTALFGPLEEADRLEFARAMRGASLNDKIPTVLCSIMTACRAAPQGDISDADPCKQFEVVDTRQITAFAVPLLRAGERPKFLPPG